MQKTWRLGDGEARAADNPRSFFIPDAVERASLQPGDLVKLIFELIDPPVGEPAAERMWVKVTDRAPGGYVGVLDNEPVVIDELHAGARIEFEPRHVIQIPAYEPDPYEGLVAFVSARLLEDDELEVGVATYDPDDVGRVLDDGQRISGWSLLAGDETEDDLDDVDQIRLPSLPWLLERYPLLREVLDTHDGRPASYELGEDGYHRVA